MTAREISFAVGKDERSVRRWIRKIADRMPDCYQKLKDSENTKIAADFTLDETVSIIRAGMGNTVADMFYENAQKAPKNQEEIKIAKIVAETVKQTLPIIFEEIDKRFENRFKSLEEKTGLTELSDKTIVALPRSHFSRFYLTNKRDKTPILAFRLKNHKPFIRFRAFEDENFKKGDRIAFIFKKSKVEVVKNEKGFLLTSSGTAGVEVNHILTKAEVETIPFVLFENQNYHSIRGVKKDSVITFMYSDVTVLEGRFLTDGK